MYLRSPVFAANSVNSPDKQAANRGLHTASCAPVHTPPDFL